MDKMDLGHGVTASLVEHNEDGKKSRLLAISYMGREACRLEVGGMEEKPLRLLAHYMALAYLSGRRDGGLEMCRAVTRTVDEVVRDLPSQQ